MKSLLAIGALVASVFTPFFSRLPTPITNNDINSAAVETSKPVPIFSRPGSIRLNITSPAENTQVINNTSPQIKWTRTAGNIGTDSQIQITFMNPDGTNPSFSNGSEKIFNGEYFLNLSQLKRAPGDYIIKVCLNKTYCSERKIKIVEATPTNTASFIKSITAVIADKDKVFTVGTTRGIKVETPFNSRFRPVNNTISCKWIPDYIIAEALDIKLTSDGRSGTITARKSGKIKIDVSCVGPTITGFLRSSIDIEVVSSSSALTAPIGLIQPEPRRADGRLITLEWDIVPGFYSYEIYRDTRPNPGISLNPNILTNPPLCKDLLNANSCKIGGITMGEGSTKARVGDSIKLEAGNAYYYRVRVVDNSSGATRYSPWSEELMVPALTTSPASYRLDLKRSGTGSGTFTFTAYTNEGTVVTNTCTLLDANSCFAMYKPGQVATLKALPSAGSTFFGWSFSSPSSGVCDGTTGCKTATVKMDKDQTVTAIFNLNPESSPSATILPLPTRTLDNGSKSILRLKVTAGGNGLSLANFAIKIATTTATLSQIRTYVYTDSNFSVPASGLGPNGQLLTVSNPWTAATDPISINTNLGIPAGETRYFDVTADVNSTTAGASISTSLVELFGVTGTVVISR
jgi:hypothetical protein